jgi:twitching motility protein PilT
MFDANTITMRQLCEMGFEKGSSDVFIKGGVKPVMKLHSSIHPLDEGLPVIDDINAKRLIYELMNERQVRIFEECFEMDLAFEVPGKCRVRANIYMAKGSPAIVCRTIPFKIRSLEELGMPSVLGELTKHKMGLILVTGPTGSGKTTTLAAMLDIVNREKSCHMVTIEDPLEYVHFDKKAHVSQREVGIDTLDFQPALRAALREAPDVILVGEMRDVTTMGAALQAGETGHLVFSTVHTSSAYETMDRIINMFPPHEKLHLCQRMANSLRAIIAQKLVPRADGQGRVCAAEILICTPTVTKAIEDGHFSDLYQHMNEGTYWGMQTMNQSLLKYVRAGLITEQVAIQYAGVASELKQMLRR